MNVTIGEKIRNLREDSDPNQAEPGKILRITQRKLSYSECRKCEPNIEDIIKICQHFKISADYLLGIPKGFNFPERCNM